MKADNSYKYPQGSACFIQSVDDDMESIMKLAHSEAMLFKFGSGAGSNLSPIRSAKEKMSGGGTASGPVSFMKGFDAFAGVVKSGGKTRRAAKMVVLNCDHPDIVEFVNCKAQEEKKAWALIDSGYDGSFNGVAYSSVFFQNMSRPSGQLTSPDEIGDETADRLKREFEERFSGANVGRLLVAGSGLKYEAMTMPAEQAQLIEQLGWTGEDCVRPFLVPAYKLGLGNPPTFNNIGQLSQEYYSTCLQGHMDGIETLLSEGLGLALNLRVDIDEEGLLRMDPLARADRAQKLMQAGAMAPDQARATEGWLPLPDGAGKVPFMQQQNYPVTVLAKRTDLMPQPAPAAPAGPAPAPAPAPAADPAKALEEAERMTAELFDRIIRGLDVDA